MSLRRSIPMLFALACCANAAPSKKYYEHAEERNFPIDCDLEPSEPCGAEGLPRVTRFPLVFSLVGTVQASCLYRPAFLECFGGLFDPAPSGRACWQPVDGKDLESP